MTRMEHPMGNQRVFLLLGVLSALFLGVFVPQHHDGINDEAFVAVWAERLLAGQIPYRDFFAYAPPGSILLLALAFKCFGISELVVRGMMVAVGLLLVLLLWTISREILPGGAALIPPLAVLVGGVAHWPIFSYHWLGIACAMGMIRALQIVIRDHTCARAGWWSALAGGCAGLAGLMLPTDGLVAGTTGLLSLILFLPRAGRGVAVIGYAVGGILPVALVATWLSLAGALSHYVEHGVRWPAANFLAFTLSYFTPRHALDLVARFASEATHLFPLSGAKLLWLADAASFVLLKIINYLLFYPLLVVGLVLLAIRFRALSPVARGQLSMLTIFLVLAALVTHYRQDMLYLNYLTPTWYVLVIWAIHPIGARALCRKMFLWGFAAILVLHAAFLVRDAARFRHPVTFPRGTLTLATQEEADRLRAFSRFLERERAGIGPVFAYPYAPSIYFLFGLRNATRFDELVPTLFTSAHVAQAKMEIERSRATHIFIFPLGVEAFKAIPMVSPDAYERANAAVLRILLAGFRPEGVIGPCLVYHRAAEPSR